MTFKRDYNIVDMSEMVDDLERLFTIESLSDTEKKIIVALSEADYNYLTLEHLQKRTRIPMRTLVRLVMKLEGFGILSSIRDVVKFVYLNPALLKKREIFHWVRLNAIRIGKLEETVKQHTFEIEKLKGRVKELEHT